MKETIIWAETKRNLLYLNIRLLRIQEYDPQLLKTF